MSGPFKMKAGKEGPMRKNFPSAFKKEVEVSGGEETTFDDKNRPMTKAELKDKKINPVPGMNYYVNIKTGETVVTKNPE